MTPLDWTIIALYFLALAGVVWWSSRRQQTSADYFLAGRNVGFFAIGAVKRCNRAPAEVLKLERWRVLLARRRRL